MKELDAKEYGYFTISKDNYESEEDFWKAVTDALRVLTDNDNQVLFEYDDCGDYIVQYVKPKFGAGKFVMVNDEDDYSPVIQSIDCSDCTNFDSSNLKCYNAQCKDYDALNSHLQNLKKTKKTPTKTTGHHKKPTKPSISDMKTRKNKTHILKKEGIYETGVERNVQVC